MKKALKTLLKVLKWFVLTLITLIVITLLVRSVGRLINSRAPEGGINRSMYIDVNGQQQWISIYGENKENPVMLFLHGGPGASTSYGDWVILRKLAKYYTVVSWDQRDCGKTWLKDAQGVPITPQIMRADLETVVDYVLDYMGKDKLTIMGISWGSMYGSDFALNHPEKVDCMISLSLVFDHRASLEGTKAEYLRLTENDEEYHKKAEKYNPLFFYDMPEEKTKMMNAFFDADSEERSAMEQKNPELAELMSEVREQVSVAQALMEKYGTEEESYFDADVNVIEAVFFNPYYSLYDYFRILQYNPETDFVLSSKNFMDDFSLKDRTVYEVPFYVMQGEQDDPGGVEIGYFGDVTAPDKEIYPVKGGHMSPMLKSEELEKFISIIAYWNKNI